MSAGLSYPVSSELSSGGGSVRLAGASATSQTKQQGSGMHIAFRKTGPSQELAVGIDSYQVWDLGLVAFFGRAGINVLEWDRVGADDGVGTGGLSLEIGVGLSTRPGPCLTIVGERDFRFGHRDDTFIGVALGACSAVAD